MDMPGAKEIEEWLLQKISACSGIPREDLDAQEPFASSGVSSREAVTLSGELEEWLGRTLSPTLLWEYPSPRALSEHLASQPSAPRAASSPNVRPEEDEHAIAIIGVACRFPGARSPQEFWALLDSGHDAIREVPPERWNPKAWYSPVPGTPGKMSTRWGGFLEGIERFDAAFFSLSPREAASMDPQQRLLLEVAWEAWESAGLVPGTLAGSKTGVFVGISTNDYARLQVRESRLPDIYMGTGNASSIAANRLSYFFDLRGPSLAVDTACSSSLVSVHLACRSLRQRECDLALAGGVNALLSPDLTVAFSQGRMMAADGRCKTFDAAADGYVRSEGCGLLVLKRLSAALADGDPIWAVLRGSAVNQDGRTNGLTAPNGLAQQAVIRQALEDAGVAAHQIDYVEAHGTGTRLGDPIEVDALKAVLLPGRPAQQTCWVGSVKTNIGHLESAAGVAGLIKVILSLENGRIPRHLHLSEPNPHLQLDGTALRFPTEAHPWPTRTGQPRRAGVSSFGFGGTNCHLIVESAPPVPAPRTRSPEELERPRHLLALSARTPGALRDTVRAYRDLFKQHPSVPLADVCFGANTGRTHFPLRVALAAADGGEMIRRLEEWMESPGRPVDSPEPAGSRKPGRIAFLFAGQGAQYPGMARQLYETHPLVRRTLRECEEIMREHFQVSLLKLLYGQEQDSRIHETFYTQTTLFAVELALARLWRSWGVEPEAVLGHSIGEYVAACLAGSFTLEEGMRLVAHRGRLMQSVPLRGAMAAVLAGEEVVAPLLSRWGSALTIAAVNSPESLTISGDREAVSEALQVLEEHGIRAKALTVSHAFHSHHMDLILDAFEDEARRVTHRALTLPLVSNVSGRILEAGHVLDASYWRTQLRSPVRLAEGMRGLLESGFDTFIEIAPKPTVAPLARGYAARGAVWLASLSPRKEDWQQLCESVATLYQRGLRIDWQGFDHGYRRQRRRLPTYPFQGEAHWFSGASQPPAPPEAERPAPTGTPDVAPSPEARHSHVLEQLRTAAAELLQIKPAELDIHQPLLDMGADSIVLIEVTNRLESGYGVKVSLRQLFEQLTTVDALARHVAGQLPPEWKPPHQVGNPAPASAPALPASNPQVPAALTGSQPSVIEQVVAQQLALMAQQLELLRGTRTPAGGSHETARPPPAPPPQERASPSRVWQLSHASPPPLDEAQRRYLDRFIDEYGQRTRASKEAARSSRGTLVDKRSSIAFRPEVKEVCYTLVSDRAAGSRLWDIDGNEYIDISMGFGVHLFGHSPRFIQQALAAQLEQGAHLGPAPALAGDVAALIRELTGVERLTFCTSGTEAVMTAIRLARAVTGRDRIAIFSGAYHGHSDTTLAVGLGANAGLASTPMSPGVPQAVADAVLVLEYGNPRSLEVLKAHGHELAAVLVEPVQSRRPDLQPREFVRECRQLTREAGALLIFDEVITGFRIHPRGAQEWFGTEADLVIYGKIAGGGMPLGVVAGQARLIDRLDGGAWGFEDDSAPRGETVYFAGTFSRHPLTLAAAKAALTHLKEQGPALQERLNQRTERLARGLNQFFEERGLDLRVVHWGSLFRFTQGNNYSYLYQPLGLELFYYHLLRQGVYVWEGRTCFLSTAHTDDDLRRIEAAVRASVEPLIKAGFLRTSRPAGVPRETSAAVPDEVPATPLPRRLPLTDAQQLLWLASQLSEEGNPAYRVSVCLELQGPLRQEALQDAVRALVARHEALRTVIDRLGTHQEIQASMPVEVSLTDIAELHVSDEASAIQVWLARDAAQPFSLTAGPLLRVQVLRQTPARHHLLVSAHHIVVDGWSLGILVKELLQLYSATCSSRAAKLPPAIPFSTLVQQLHARADGEAMRAHERYWLERFSTPVTGLELPADLPRPASGSYRGGRHATRLPASASRALKQVCGREHCTPFMALFAVYSVVLHRLTRQDDLVIGVPVADRDVEGGAGVIGYCTNLLAIRSHLSAHSTFSEFLQRLKPLVMGAFEHREYPFARLLQQLRTLGRAPAGELIRATFNLERPAGPPQVDGLAAAFVSQPARYSAFELSLNATELEDGLLLELDYSTALFTEATARGLLDCYRAVLSSVLEEPAREVHRLPLISEQERRAWAGEGSVPKGGARPPESVQTLFEAAARHHAEACAVSDGPRRLSYRELNQRANQVAHHLLARGIQPEEPVGLYLERSAELLVGLLGILKAGAAYVPLDASTPTGRLELLLSETRARLVLTRESLRAHLPAGTASLCLDEASGPLALASTEDPPVRVSGHHLAYVMYTSGSTGRPKGVMVTQRGLAHYVTWAVEAYRFGQGGGAPLHGSLAFDATLTSLLPPLVAGKEVVVIGEQAPLDTLATGLKGRPGWSVLKITPAHLKALESLLPTPTLSGSVHTVVIGGEALSSAILAPWQRHSPGVTFVNEYGPTETVVGCCIHSVAGGEALTGTIPIGRPLPYTRLYLLDDGLQHVPAGMVGELYIGGAGVARGYFGRPDLTAASFIPDPWSTTPGERLYKTGDLARRMADGTLVFVGRRDAQVKIRGYRVELEEIQVRLATHPAVAACHVTARPGPDGEPVLVAYVVNPHPTPLPSEALARHLAGTLPAYMLPAHFVFLPALPLTENGKVDQRALPAPRPPAQGVDSREPRSETEKALAALWKALLDVEQVGAGSNFFELGGHSLLAGQLIARIREQFGIELPLRALFDTPTLGHLAERIDRERGGTAPSGAGTIQRQSRARHRAVRDAAGGLRMVPEGDDHKGGRRG